MIVGGEGPGEILLIFSLGRCTSGSPDGSFWTRTSVVSGWDPFGVGCGFLAGPFVPGKSERVPCRACVTPGLRTSLHFLFISFGACVPRAGHSFIRVAPVGHSFGSKYLGTLSPSICLRARTERMCALSIETPREIVIHGNSAGKKGLRAVTRRYKCVLSF